MLPCRFQDEGLHFLGAVPEDKLLRSVRLDEVQTALDAEFSFGSRVQLDQVCVGLPAGLRSSPFWQH